MWCLSKMFCAFVYFSGWGLVIFCDLSCCIILLVLFRWSIFDIIIVKLLQVTLATLGAKNGLVFSKFGPTLSFLSGVPDKHKIRTQSSEPLFVVC